MIGTHEVDLVTSFTYLGVAIINELGCSSSEIRRRIKISRSLFNQLEVLQWKTHVSLATKIRLHQVLTVLLYGAETWVTCQTDLHRLDAFDMWCQRKILGIGWMDRVTNIAIRRTGLQPVSTLVRERRLRRFWAHHSPMRGL